MREKKDLLLTQQYLLSVTLLRESISDRKKYPFSIPALRRFRGLRFHPHVTYFVGENGSGKSTLLEAIAIAAGFNPEGGSKNFHFSTRASLSDLHKHLRSARGWCAIATVSFCARRVISSGYEHRGTG